MLRDITVHGARQHNLKSIDVTIPRGSLTVITGLSGSGKSSLAFDTIYAEGQRRYVETLSPYARQFLDQMERPEVDSIEGLSPAISIEQKTTSRSPRSTVGTVTEIYDYLRVLYSSIGEPLCPNCGQQISRQTTDAILQQVMALPNSSKLIVMAPIVRGRKGEFKKELEKILKAGHPSARIDDQMVALDEGIPALDKRKNHTIEIIIHKLVLKPGIQPVLEKAIETAAKLADGLVLIATVGGEERLFSQRSACMNCGTSVPDLEPRSFSFNSPYGACQICNGLGSQWDFDADKVVVDPGRPLFNGGLGPGSANQRIKSLTEKFAAKNKIDLEIKFDELPQKSQDHLLYGTTGFKGILKLLREFIDDVRYEGYKEYLMDFMSPTTCAVCQGKRLRASSLAVKVKGTSIAEFTSMSLGRALSSAQSWKLSERERKVAGRVVEEITQRLQFLIAVGLEYLSLERSSSTLSGGESQRIRLATQIGSKLRGVLYVLDEPSIGLHPRDNDRLLGTLRELRDLGNTVLVVEHDQETIEQADYVIDLGPAAGRLGGEVVASGTPQQIRKTKGSLTGQYMSGSVKIEVPTVRRKGNGEAIKVFGAREHNLKNINVEFPLGKLLCITGVSGGGKSTLINDILYASLSKELYKSRRQPGAHDRIEGFEHVDKVVEIDQAPIGRTPRSNPATYTGLFTQIRDLYSMLPEARERGYKSGRFSFNVKGGRCEACQGDGLKRIEMNFLPDVFVTCDICRGRRYNSETLEVKYKGLSISDLLETTIEDALPLLDAIPGIKNKLQTLVDVGLGYLHLGQQATTLSGGEAQRVKLSKELSKRQTGKTFYILDEPTTGLHFDDVRKLLEVLQRLVDLGNTVLVIEHNLDVIKCADWIIDLGPEGGEAGGQVVGVGTPEKIAKVKASHTGAALSKLLLNPKVLGQ
jgi:excinuclease ABC subunit A